MLADLGRGVYAADFELHYLDETAAYYAREAARAMRELRPPQYLSMAEERLQAEAERVANYLDAATAAPATAAVERELLGRHAAAIISAEDGGAVALMERDALGDLARMYRLLGRVEGGHDLLRAAMGDHVRASGAALVRSCSSSATSAAASASAAAAAAASASASAAAASAAASVSASASAEAPREPIAFVERLLSEKAKYDTIVARSFASDRAFGNALNAAFEHFVNLAPRAPEFVSLYMDDRLRRAARGGAGGATGGGTRGRRRLRRRAKTARKESRPREAPSPTPRLPVLLPSQTPATAPTTAAATTTRPPSTAPSSSSASSRTRTSSSATTSSTSPSGCCSPRAARRRAAAAAGRSATTPSGACS